MDSLVRALQMDSWIRALKTGDKVVCLNTGYAGNKRDETLQEVRSVSSARVTLTNGWKFWKKTQRMVGDTTSHIFLCQYTAEAEQRINDDKRRKQLHHELSQVLQQMNVIPLDRLERIKAVLDEPEAGEQNE
jgi:hypothetical protein